MTTISRIGESKRWSDIVVHNGVAYWVEVADDPHQDMTGQAKQVLAQVDATLERLGSSREKLIQILVYLADLDLAPHFNQVWDQWVPEGHAPIRACVGAKLSAGYLVELVVTAAAN